MEPCIHHALFPQSKPTAAAGTCRRLSLVEAFGGATVTLDTPIARLRQQKFRRHQELMSRQDIGAIPRLRDAAWKRSP
jgi:hypothetical protein